MWEVKYWSSPLVSDQEGISKEQQLALRTFMLNFGEKLRGIKDPVRAVNKMLELITASRLNGK